MIGIDGPEPFTSSVSTEFGEEATLGGFSLVSMPLDELQRLDGTEGLLRYIDVAAEPGVDQHARIRVLTPRFRPTSRRFRAMPWSPRPGGHR